MKVVKEKWIPQHISSAPPMTVGSVGLLRNDFVSILLKMKMKDHLDG
jgi:hypothetical protein